METMKNWKVELTTGEKKLKIKIHGDIFQGDELSALLFIIEMMPFNNLGNTQEAKLQEKIDHRIYFVIKK